MSRATDEARDKFREKNRRRRNYFDGGNSRHRKARILRRQQVDGAFGRLWADAQRSGASEEVVMQAELLAAGTSKIY